MRLILLTCLTMIAFAANSVLNRMAVDGGGIDPSSFAMIRVLAGAVALCMILTVRGGGLPLLHRDRMVGAFSLAAYMIGFSLAYVTLDAGLGALILFGTVQVTMFGWSALRGGHPTTRQLMGASMAFGGLLIALWPDDTAGGDITGAALMVVAGLGWAAYTLVGKRATDPLAATAANFVWTLPILAVLLFGTGLQAAPSGIALAILSGAVTSGLGYALWYSILPQLAAQTAAVLQLSVPIIAIAGGALLLGEALSLSLALAAALVIGGIAVAVTASTAQAGHN
ncbi:DMT family transporter [Tateyamaria omphalii]|uniref:EamA family transporter n=1 Tax=Tateyamaria omphalii TaxID=299262 RepID=A0A1P8MW53_9RHOB|nr:DMT family transporter [Tateyamaria omphalii]APX12233.1 EamA family transporter [Tateyamaria omphalii]